MFANRYFAARYFPDRYFGDSNSLPAVIDDGNMLYVLCHRRWWR